MHADKKLRIIVFDDDPGITTLLKTMISGMGHNVLTFPDPTACAVYKKPDCECPQEFPCADVVIADVMMPHVSGIDLFKLLRKRGCKALDANKAFMSAAITDEQKKAVEELHCHFFKKPFKLYEVKQWIDDCAARVPEGRILAKLG